MKVDGGKQWASSSQMEKALSSRAQNYCMIKGDSERYPPGRLQAERLHG